AKLQSQLISDLLDLSRVASAKLRLELVAQPVLPIVALAVDSVRPMAQAKSQTLMTKFPSRPLVARLDKGRLEQVLLNLLNNAINFTPAGGRITVSVRPNDGNVEIEVADTGKGI